MAASKENGVSDSRAVYTPPCVVRMSDSGREQGFVHPWVRETQRVVVAMEILRPRNPTLVKPVTTQLMNRKIPRY